MDFVLPPLTAADSMLLSGVVLYPDGRPAPLAEVGFGRDIIRAGMDGSFAFEDVLARDSLDTPLSAWLPGFQPARLERVGSRFAEDPGAAARLVLQFPGEAQTLQGTVLTASGQPAAGIHLNALSPTALDVSFLPLEARVGNRGREVVTDANGHFELPGLMSRSYRLRLWRPERMPLGVTEALQPGPTEHIIRLEAPRRQLRGRVRSPEGEPVAGAMVAIAFETYANGGGGSLWETSSPVRTDGEGRFTLDEAPASVGFVGVQSADGERSLHPVAGLSADGELDLVFRPERRMLEVRPQPELRATSFRVLDAGGRALEVEVHAGNRIEGRREVAATAPGTFPVCVLPLGAAAISFSSSEGEICRQEIPDSGSERVLMRGW